VASTIDCKYVEANGLATLYLEGRLSQGEAEAFEQHYLSCESCRNDLQTMSELRAALGKPAVVPIDRRSASAPAWRLLAAAAAMSIAAFGIWQLAHRPATAPASPVYRGPNDVLTVKREAFPDGMVRLTWVPNAEAQTYLVEVLTADGVSVWKKETPETKIALESSSLGAHQGVSLDARVQALDSMRQVVATSDLISLTPH
jgi:hypothetical protein